MKGLAQKSYFVFASCDFVDSMASNLKYLIQ